LQDFCISVFVCFFAFVGFLHVAQGDVINAGHIVDLPLDCSVQPWSAMPRPDAFILPLMREHGLPTMSVCVPVNALVNRGTSCLTSLIGKHEERGCLWHRILSKVLLGCVAFGEVCATRLISSVNLALSQWFWSACPPPVQFRIF